MQNIGDDYLMGMTNLFKIYFIFSVETYFNLAVI